MRRRIYKTIVSYPKTFIILFVILTVISAHLRTLVPVNYEISDYLPEHSPSTRALHKLESEFEGGIPNARVMVKNVNIAEALKYKKDLENCVGVSDVMWLDDAIDLMQPLEIADQDLVQNYYKDEAALYTVTIKDGYQVQAVEAIRKIIGPDNAMNGDAVSTALATTGTVKEVLLVTIVAIIFVFLVLILTTESWAEPILVMIGLGVAVLINSGTHIIFGEISFVTHAAGMILQIAVSLDYSVFLIHRFAECQKDISDPKEAMVEAMSKSARSIFSSGLTTVIGFLALLFMQFGIGPDLGQALAKGVLISLITVFAFMAPLVLRTYRLMEKSKHKSFLPSFERFGRFMHKMMIPMSIVFVLIIAPSFLASNANDYYYGPSHIYGEGTKLGKDSLAIEKQYGQRDNYVVMVPKGDLAREKDLSQAIKNLPEVKSIISYVDTVGAEIPMEMVPQDTLKKLVSDQFSRFVVTVDADFEGKASFDLVERMRKTINEYYPDKYYLAGSGVTAYDLMKTITQDTVKVNLIAIFAVFFVLLLTLRSLTLPVLLVLAIETAVWLNLSIPYFFSHTVFYISYLIISSVQLGATVDYAILFTERYMEYREEMPKRSALFETVTKVTPSVLTSGTVMAVVGFLLGKVSSHGILAQLGVFIGRGSIFSLSIVLLVLPGLLYLLDSLIKHTTLNANFYKGEKELIENE